MWRNTITSETRTRCSFWLGFWLVAFILLERHYKCLSSWSLVISWMFTQQAGGSCCRQPPTYSWFQISALFWMSYAFFWVWRLNFICRRFGTLCLFHLHRQVGMKSDWGWEMLGCFAYLHACEDGTECSETSAYKIRTPGNYLAENIQPPPT